MLRPHETPTRRDILKGLGMGLSSLVYSTHGSAAHERAGRPLRGRVYDATTSPDGTAPGCGLAGVMVSNGRDVALTDQDGIWSLPADCGYGIFVVKPPHWTSPGGPGIPQTFYAAPGSGQPLDFPLIQAAEDENFEALLFADTQAGNSAELNYVREVMLHGCRTTQAAFAINHGDVVDGDLSLFGPYRALLAETGLPWHHCPGNHDMDFDAADPAFAFETWKRAIGPTHYAFRYARATFILLNNVGYLGATAPDIGGRRYYGRFGEDQLRFVKNVLRHVPEDDLVVISMHIPLTSYLEPASISETTVDRTRLMKLISSRPNTISFAGHSHTTEHHYLGPEHGFSGRVPHHHHVLTAACGSWWGGPHDARGIPMAHSQDGSPKGHHVLTVRGGEAATRFVPFDAPGGVPMRAMVDQSAGRRLLVNVFDGGPKTEVTCHLAGLGMDPMQAVRRQAADPFIVAAFETHRPLYRPWVAPALSSHLWELRLPDTLAAGSYEFVIRARDESGCEHEARHRLDVPA